MIINSWTIAKADYERRSALSDELGIHPVIAQLLINRGVRDTKDARSFLNPSLSDLPDPFLLPDMEEAVERIVHAVQAKERIAVFGDYDVDGVTSSALLTRFFRSFGVDLDIHIPKRLGEGYGLNTEALVKFKDLGVNLVITVDNGIRNVAEVEDARKMGMDVVITDHHEAGDELPRANAIVNPKLKKSRYPERELAGCGVAFALVMALRKRLRELKILGASEPNLKELLDLVATGTIADVVPLRGVNRIFARFGLEQLKTGTKPGVAALMQLCGLVDPSAPVRAGHVAFRIAPRINAAGRLGDARAAYECLITEDSSQARELAESLHRANAERQAIEENILTEACEFIESSGQCDSAGFVAYGQKWHPGVVGIVASRVAQMFGKPCAVIGSDGYFGKGSVRSANGVNVVRALARAADLLVKFGGHADAAGFTIEPRHIESFRAQFNLACSELEPRDAKPVMSIDAEIDAESITDKLVTDLALLEPFGIGNPEPVLCAPDLEIVESTVVGESHLRLRLRGGGAYFTAIGFDMAGLQKDLNANHACVFVPQHNTWNGQTTVQLKIKAFIEKC